MRLSPDQRRSSISGLFITAMIVAGIFYASSIGVGSVSAATDRPCTSNPSKCVTLTTTLTSFGTSTVTTTSVSVDTSTSTVDSTTTLTFTDSSQVTETATVTEPAPTTTTSETTTTTVPGSTVTVTETTTSNSTSTSSSSSGGGGGGGGGGSCVLQGSMIMLPNGTQVPVENVVPGMEVLSYDTSSGSFVTTVVTSNAAITVTSVLNINDGQLYASGPADQRIYVMLTNGVTEWLPIEDLQVGMKVYQPIQEVWVMVSSLQWVSGTFVVYDLRVDSLSANDYIANWILVDVKI